MTEVRCKGKTKAGRPCKSRRVGEDGYCHRHSPAREEEKRLAKLEEERKLEEQRQRECEAYDAMGKMLRRGEALPDEIMPCGITTWDMVDRVTDRMTKDERMKKLLLAEAHGYRRALTHDYKLTTVLERMLADRIVLSYLRLLHFELIADNNHGPGTQTLGHLEGLRKLVTRQSAEFLRNVRALKDLKTVPMRLTIRDADQVNVGQQQVNVTEDRQARQAKEVTAEVRDAERSETKALGSTQAREEDQ